MCLRGKMQKAIFIKGPMRREQKLLEFKSVLKPKIKKVFLT